MADGRLGGWEPEPNAWLLWKRHKAIEADGGPRVPINVLARLIDSAQGHTEALDSEHRAPDPDTARQAQANDHARKLRHWASLMVMLRRDAEAAQLEGVANRLTRSQHKSPITRQRGRAEILSAHWPAVE